MAKKALFTNLIFDETGQPVETAVIGNESFYVVNDAGFRRHISSEEIDRIIMKSFTDQMKGNEDYLSKQAASMIGSEDIFTVAVLRKQMQNIDSEIDKVLEIGLPTDAVTYLGMMGMKITVNYRGEIIAVDLPKNPDIE